MRPIDLLKKHLDLNPKLSIAASVHEDGTMMVDITAPGNLPDLVYLYYELGRKLDRMHEGARIAAIDAMAKKQKEAQ